MKLRLIALAGIICAGMLLGIFLYSLQPKEKVASSSLLNTYNCDTLDTESLDSNDASVMGGLRSALPTSGCESASPDRLADPDEHGNAQGSCTVSHPGIALGQVVIPQAQVPNQFVQPVMRPAASPQSVPVNQMSPAASNYAPAQMGTLPAVAHMPAQGNGNMAPPMVSSTGSYRVPVSSGDGVRIMTVVNR